MAAVSELSSDELIRMLHRLRRELWGGVALAAAATMGFVYWLAGGPGPVETSDAPWLAGLAIVALGAGYFATRVFGELAEVGRELFGDW